MGVTSQNTRKYQYFLWLKHIVSSILATVDELDLAEALHPDDPEEVVDDAKVLVQKVVDGKFALDSISDKVRSLSKSKMENLRCSE